jgi:hypothetical protein
MQRVETEPRSGRSRAWTYLIVAMVLIALVLLGNVVLSNPDASKHALDRFLGLPGWALTVIVGVVGAIIYWLGLKVEADWPEHLGAVMIAAAATAGELLFGWHRLEFGGLVVLPYLVAPLILVVLFVIAMKKGV